MMLTYFVFLAALALEGLGSYISVVGLSSKSSFIMIALAITLDFSKIIIASVLFKNWKDLNILFRAFLTPVLLFLIVITSYGAYAFMLQEFSKTTITQELTEVKIASLKEERSKLEARKLDMDKQISDVPSNFVSQKKKLMETFAGEIEFVNKRVQELDVEIPKLKMDSMKDVTQSGTLGSLATAWGTTPAAAARILAFLMVFVVDPLAVVLLMVGNFLYLKESAEKIESKNRAIRMENERLARFEGGRVPQQSNNGAVGLSSVLVKEYPVAEGVKTISELVESVGKKSSEGFTPEQKHELQTMIKDTEVKGVKGKGWQDAKPTVLN